MTPEPARGPEGASRAPVRWGLGDAAAGFLAAVFLTSLAATAWASATGQSEESLGLVVAALVARWVGLAGTALVASRLKGTGSLAEDFGLRVEGRDVVPGLAVGLASQYLLLPLVYLPVRLLDPDADVSGEARRLFDLADGGGLALLVLCVVVGAPLVEELFYRGLCQRALDRRFGAVWAVVGSSLFFGVTHLQPLQLLGLVAFGGVLGVLAQRTGRLGPGLVAHMAFNAATAVTLVVSR